MEQMEHGRNLIKQLDTSFFLYDLDGLKQHMSGIKKMLHPQVKVWYACKANPLRQVLRTLNDIGVGVDVASLGELHQAQAAGMQSHSMIATGPAKSPAYLKQLLESGVSTIIIESINQLKDLNFLAASRGKQQDALLRVQLEWPDDVKSVLGGAAITPFGLGLQDWKKVDLKPFSHLNIRGLHCFQWGNILDLEKLAFVWDTTIHQCQELAREKDISLEVLDLGGGLGVSYSDNSELSFKAVNELLMSLKDKYQLQEIWLELGRYTMANYGSYFTKIIDIKEVRGKNIIVTEGGINHLARPALVGEPFPAIAMDRPGKEKKYSVHGPLCTALDHLGDFEFSAHLATGDWLMFKKCGAYGFTESMPYFLCHQLAAEAFVTGGQLSVARAPASAREWMA